MSGKLFVHIGLPKTATTTLQIEFFPELANGGIRYLGVFQPRSEREQDDLYTGCIGAAWGVRPMCDARAELAAALASADAHAGSFGFELSDLFGQAGGSFDLPDGF